MIYFDDVLNEACDNMGLSVMDGANNKIIYEMEGNPEKNKAFKEILDEADNLCKYNLEKITNCNNMTLDVIDKVIKLKKDPAKAYQIAYKLNRKELNDYIASLRSKYSVNGPKTFENIKKLVSVFNNKYSEFSIREKDIFAAKINSYIVDINKQIARIGTKNEVLNNKLDSILGEAEDLSKAYNEIVDCLNYAVDEANWTVQDITALSNLCDTKKIKRSLIYKITKMFK